MVWPGCLAGVYDNSRQSTQSLATSMIQHNKVLNIVEFVTVGQRCHSGVHSSGKHPATVQALLCMGRKGLNTTCWGENIFTLDIFTPSQLFSGSSICFSKMTSINVKFKYKYVHIKLYAIICISSDLNMSKTNQLSRSSHHYLL